MKKIKKNDLRLEKEVISALTESDLGSMKGGINKPPQTIINVDCVHPLSYDNNCKTMDLAGSCAASCGGGCTVKSVNIICIFTRGGANCEVKPVSQGDESVCYCLVP